MASFHEGGCMCGAVRFRVSGEPARTSACHCTWCQRRSGSAFGIGAYFEAGQVELSGAPRGTYEHRSDMSGRWIRTEFCKQCGTTVSWTAEAMPGWRALAGGAFDDPKWFRIERHSWLRSAHSWFKPPEDVEQLQQSGLPKPGK